MPDAQSVKEFALAYADLGYRVFPCVPNTKRPLTKEGLRAASTDSEQIKAWWRRFPSANLAVLPPADVLVLDFDDRMIAERWLTDYPELTRAPQTRTPRGGLHVWLRVAGNPEQIKTRVKAAEKEVDLRGLARAYLLTPPSQTKNGIYRWEHRLILPEYLPLASAGLLERVIPPKEEADKVEALPSRRGSKLRRYALAALESEHHLVATTSEGARNDRLNRAAYALGGYAAHDLLSREEIKTALTEAAQRCGLPVSESLRTIESGLKAGLESPRALPNHHANQM